MLCAKRQSDGMDAIAFSESKANAPFICPECDQEVYLRAGTVRVSHFAHKNPDACPFSTGESDEHRRCKMEIYGALLKGFLAISQRGGLPTVGKGVGIPSYGVSKDGFLAKIGSQMVN